MGTDLESVAWVTILWGPSLNNQLLCLIQEEGCPRDEAVPRRHVSDQCVQAVCSDIVVHGSASLCAVFGTQYNHQYKPSH